VAERELKACVSRRRDLGKMLVEHNWLGTAPKVLDKEIIAQIGWLEGDPRSQS